MIAILCAITVQHILDCYTVRAHLRVKKYRLSIATVYSYHAVPLCSLCAPLRLHRRTSIAKYGGYSKANAIFS